MQTLAQALYFPALLSYDTCCEPVTTVSRRPFPFAPSCDVQEELEAREAAAAAAASKAATRASLEENAVLQAAKREAEERRRADDLRAMMEYSAFVEAQEVS